MLGFMDKLVKDGAQCPRITLSVSEPQGRTAVKPMEDMKGPQVNGNVYRQRRSRLIPGQR